MITQFPILILANYRTGSTALLHSMASEYSLERFSEPHLRPESMQTLSDKIENKQNDSIIKFMPDQIVKYQIYQYFYNSDCYKIKLQRRDRVAQITSFYASLMSGKWHEYKSVPPTKKYSIPFNDEVADRAIDQILHNDKLFEEMDIKFDQELFYEDLNLESTPFISKLPSLINYNKIYLYLEHKLQIQSELATKS
jgi:LPS sulfotransferase NodH